MFYVALLLIIRCFVDIVFTVLFLYNMQIFQKQIHLFFILFQAASCNTGSTKGASGAAASSQLHSKTASNQNPSSKEPALRNDICESSGASDCPTTEPSEAGNIVSSILPSDYRNFCPEAEMKSGAIGRKQRQEKDCTLRRPRVTESCKVSKEQRVERKTKTGEVRGRGSEMVRKSMKGVGISGSSGIRHLAVGVAS